MAMAGLALRMRLGRGWGGLGGGWWEGGAVERGVGEAGWATATALLLLELTNLLGPFVFRFL